MFIYTDDIYYPYSGYVDSSGKIRSQGYGKRDTTYNYNRDIPTSQSELSSVNTNYTLYIDGPIKFTNVTYSKYDIKNIGYLRAVDKDLEYSYIEKGLDIISCTVQVGSWENVGKWYNPKYSAKYNNNPETLTGEELESKHKTAYNRLVSVLNGKNGSNMDIAGDWISNLFTEPTSTFGTQNKNNSYGYQIRCVKE